MIKYSTYSIIYLSNRTHYFIILFPQEHDQECRRLVQKYPDMSAPIRTKLTELQDNWRNLQTLAASRREGNSFIITYIQRKQIQVYLL